MLRNIRSQSMLALLVVLAASASADNSVINPGFEQGETGWLLTSEKGVVGGAITEDGDGNHALSATGDIYWMASTNHRVFGPIPREQFAGKQVRLTFRARGDQDAYPGFTLACRGPEKTEYLTLFWRTQYVESRITLGEQFTTYEATRSLPEQCTAIVGLSVYNCTQRGTIAIDDVTLSFVDPVTETAGPGEPADEWPAVELSNTELLEFGNTCNFLVAEWGRLYGMLLDLERAAYYARGGEKQPQRASTEKLRSEVMRLRGRLLALQDCYTIRFRNAFGEQYSIAQPYRFYAHNNMAGRDMMMAAGRTRSSKPEFLQVEQSFAEARAAIEALLAELGATPPLPRPTATPDEPLFGPGFFPAHPLLGLRATQYSWFSYQWLDSDFAQVSNLAEWEFDEQERMRRVDGPFDREVKHYDLRWQLMSWFDPRVRISYQRPSFRSALEQNHDLYAATELGPVLPTQERRLFDAVNTYDPYVRDYARAYTRELGALFAADDRVVFTELLAEPAPMVRQEGLVYPMGYNRVAVQQFRTALEDKFQTIARLNEGWGSDYASFDAIEPPKLAALEALAPADLPLIYEWRAFGKRAYADFGRMLHDAYREGDAARHPVANRLARMYLNGTWPPDPFDALGLADGSTDILCTHNCAEGNALNRAELVYYHSLARHLNKPRGSLEFYPFAPESNHFRPGPEYGFTLFTRGVNNLYQALAWDVTTICAWLQNSIGYVEGRNNGVWSPTRESGHTLLHDSSGAIAEVKAELAAGFDQVLTTTRIVRPAVGMLAPYDAPMVCWPGGQVATEGQLIHRFLEDRNYDYTCVPEELILADQKALDGIKVLLTPYTLWASRPLQQKLLEWVSAGGVLICVGPFGYWDEYGRSCRLLIDETFGEVPIEMTRGGIYQAALPPGALATRDGVSIETALETANGPQPHLVRAGHGSGAVYVTVDTTIDALPAAGRQRLRETIDRAIGVRTAWTLNGSFELITREQSAGSERYLVAINRSLETVKEDTVVAVGEYPAPRDIGIPGGIGVPARVGAGVTAFSLRLGPGEGTCLDLGAYRPVSPSPAEVERFLQAETAAGRGRVTELLSQISTDTDSVAYARAAICREKSLSLLAEAKADEAAEMAARAVRYAAEGTPAGGEAPAAESIRVAEVSDLAAATAGWDAAPWTQMESARLKSLWDADTLAFLIEVQDAEVRNDARPPRLWGGDAVEIYLDILAEGGDRKLGLLDYQYCVAPDGQVQVEGRAVTGARATGALTPDGYRIAVAIPNAETGLMPTAAYTLAFNIRVLDYGMRDGQFANLGERVLKETGRKFFTSTLGWPLLRLIEQRGVPAPAQATWDAAARRITVSGDGNTLKSIAGHIARPDTIRLDGNTATLAADLELADGAQLVLGDETLTGAGEKLPAISAGGGCRIHLTGSPVLAGIDAYEALRSCRLTARTRGRITLTRTIALRLTDDEGHAIPDTVFALRATPAGAADAVYEARGRTDVNGAIHFDLTAADWDVEFEKVVARAMAYDLYVDDIGVTAAYAIRGIDPLAGTDYHLTCGINR